MPYFCTRSATTGLFISIGVTAVALLLFVRRRNRDLPDTQGAVKHHWTGGELGMLNVVKSAVGMLIVGAIAAASSFGIVRALDSSGVQ